VRFRLNGVTSAQVEVQTGRADFPAVVKAIAAERGSGECMGVWCSGPKTMNNVVYEAVGRLGGDVRFFPVSYEM
jgi:hypothetical protein